MSRPKPLTEHQRRSLMAFVRFERVNGRWPTVRELTAEVHQGAPVHHNSMTAVIDAVIAKGWMTKGDSVQARGLRLTEEGREALGVVMPDDAFDLIESAIANGGPNINTEILRVIERCRTRGDQ